MPFYKIDSHYLKELAAQQKAVIQAKIEGRVFSITKIGENIKAFSDKCPHAGTVLSTGYIDNRNCIVCPRHGYRFELERGYNTTGEGYRLKIFQTEKRGEDWYIEIA